MKFFCLVHNGFIFFQMSERVLFIYSEMFEEIQWEVLKYLVALVNYSSHVTDDFDMRLLQTYMNFLL